jgi:hypothetical protein
MDEIGSVDPAHRELKRRQKAAERAAAPPPPASGGDLWRVEQADCLDWLAAQDPGSIDLVFGSPPYEDKRLYLENGKDLGIARDTEEWVRWMVDVYKAALRCCKGLVAFVVDGPTENYSWSAAPHLLAADLRRGGVTLRHDLFYRRNGTPGSGSLDWLRNTCEFVVCATRGGRLLWSDNTAMGHAPKHRPGGDPSHRTQDGSRVNRGGYGTADERANRGSHRAQRDAGCVYVPPEVVNPGNVIEPNGHTTRGYRDGDTLNGHAYRPPEVVNPGNVIEPTWHSKPTADGTREPFWYVPPDLANPGNVIDCGAVGGGNMGDRICHDNEAPFDEYLAEFVIRSFCPPGGVVADPFSGSGTTAVMAVRLGRRFRGCDLRESQVMLTRQRLADAEEAAGAAAAGG